MPCGFPSIGWDASSFPSTSALPWGSGGIGPGTELELMPDGTGLRLEPLPRAEREIREADGLPILGFVAGAHLDDETVRDLRDQMNR